MDENIIFFIRLAFVHTIENLWELKVKMEWEAISKNTCEKLLE